MGRDRVLRAGRGAASRSAAAVLTNALLKRATRPATASPGRALFASPRQRVPDLAARGLRTRVRAPAEGGVRGRGAARRRLRAAGEGPSRREKEEGPRRLAGVGDRGMTAGPGRRGVAHCVRARVRPRTHPQPFGRGWVRGLRPVAAARQQDWGSGPRSGGDNGVRKVTPAGAGSRPVRAGGHAQSAEHKAGASDIVWSWLVSH